MTLYARWIEDVSDWYEVLKDHNVPGSLKYWFGVIPDELRMKHFSDLFLVSIWYGKNYLEELSSDEAIDVVARDFGFCDLDIELIDEWNTADLLKRHETRFELSYEYDEDYQTERFVMLIQYFDGNGNVLTRKFVAEG
jgi:hypothetical protein